MAMNSNPDYLVIIKQVPDPTKPSEAGLTVIAPLPDSFANDSTNEYSAPFAQGLFGQGAIGQALSAGGIRVASQAMTAQLWQGSNESDLMLDLEFHTETDPDTDVRQPVLTLLKLAAASVDSATGLLKSPGPQISLSDLSGIAGAAGSQLATSIKQGSSALGSIVGQVKPGKMNAQNANLNSSNQNTKPVADNGLGGSQYWKSVVRNQISIQIGRYAYFDSVVILNTQETKSHQMDARTGLPLHSKVSVRFKPMFQVTQEDLEKIFALRGK